MRRRFLFMAVLTDESIFLNRDSLVALCRGLCAMLAACPKFRIPFAGGAVHEQRIIRAEA